MNTAIAAMMTAVNEMTANGVTKGDMGILLRLLNPFAPHITEELWEHAGLCRTDRQDVLPGGVAGV